MAFTDRDHTNEILIKVLIAEADERPTISESTREVVMNWIDYLQIEGPELERILTLLERDVDSIQAEIFFNELRATLSKKEQKERILAIVNEFIQHRTRIYPFEQKLLDRIINFVNDTSGIERLFDTQFHTDTDS